MEHNDSHKFESGFVSVRIPESNSVMLGPLAGMKLGIWVAHGEGKFRFPTQWPDDQIALRYNYKSYPGNPNGSPGAVAGIVSADGRHLAMMPHLERAISPGSAPSTPTAGATTSSHPGSPPSSTPAAGLRKTADLYGRTTVRP